MGIWLRALLAAYSPTPFGYVWDVYQEGVRVLHRTHALPRFSDCWQCYHPPFYYVLGWPFYAAGRLLDDGTGDRTAILSLNALALLCAAVTAYFGYRLFRLYRVRGWTLVLAMGLLLSFPAFFISSYSADADIVLTAILSAFIYYFAREGFRRRADGAWGPLRLGVLAGLATATKYSGMVALPSALALYALRAAHREGRGRALRDAVIVLVVCCAIGGWKYADNVRVHGTPLFANGSASEGFAFSAARRFPSHYEFTTFRLGDVLRLTARGAPAGTLTAQPVYSSVPTTLHALAWTDMSMFSVPGRHGESTLRFRKLIPQPVIASVLVLGIVADLLAVAGVVATARHRSTWPLLVCSVLSVAAYVWWFLAQDAWALKTKYLLFLLPVFVLYVVFGWRWVCARSRVAGNVAGGLLAALVVAAHVYGLAFALGKF